MNDDVPKNESVQGKSIPTMIEKGKDSHIPKLTLSHSPDTSASESEAASITYQLNNDDHDAQNNLPAQNPNIRRPSAKRIRAAHLQSLVNDKPDTISHGFAKPKLSPLKLTESHADPIVPGLPHRDFSFTPMDAIVPHLCNTGIKSSHTDNAVDQTTQESKESNTQVNSSESSGHTDVFRIPSASLPSAPTLCSASPFGIQNNLDYEAFDEEDTRSSETPKSSVPAESEAPDVYSRHGMSSILTNFSYEFINNFSSQLYSSEFENSQDFKSERIRNFLNVPVELEKFIFFAYFICLDSFLFIFTILPLRIALALFSGFGALLVGNWSLFLSAHKTDLLKGLLMIVCFTGLQFVDASRLYHSVRGQSVIKLYVIFGVLEICDKLCSAFGHDILDSLFSISTSSKRNQDSASRRHISRVTRFIVASVYIFAHTIVLFYQVVTLNVAINSYNNALLTLLLSNQFSELKTSVFKRFEKENLFQLSCSDVVERFQLSVFLLIVTIRNYSEILGVPFVGGAWSSLIDLMMLWVRTSWYVGHVVFQYIISLIVEKSPGEEFTFLPQIVDLPEFKLAETLVTPVLVVFGTEMLVDWLKHAFITKFNNIPPTVYARYRDSLCRDLLGIIADRAPPSSVGTPLTPAVPDQSPDRGPIVAKRLGFVSIPLASLVLKVFFQIIRDSEDLTSGPEIKAASNTSPEEDAVLIKRLSIPLPQWIKADGQWSFFSIPISPILAFIAIYLSLLVLKVLVGTLLRQVAESILLDSLKQEKEAPIDIGFQFPTGSIWSQSMRSSTIDPLSQLSEQRSSLFSRESKAVTPDTSPRKRRVTNTVGNKVVPSSPLGMHEPLMESPLLKIVQEEQPQAELPKVDDKLDRIDRFTMVKSRII